MNNHRILLHFKSEVDAQYNESVSLSQGATDYRVLQTGKICLLYAVLMKWLWPIY